ncbi:MAG: hypothetical protein ACRC4X_01055, partial [Cetobacterium sp.]
DLIKGLNWSYKEIKQEIKTLNYLIKSIKTGMNQKEKKLVIKAVPEVVQEEILKENKLDLEKNQELKITEIEKIKITENEYEDLYKEFLKEEKTGHTLLARKGFDIANKNKYEIIASMDSNDENKILEITAEIFSLDKIPQEKLLSKTGKLLTGGALYARLTKIAKDEGIRIQYRDEIIN